MEIVPVDLFGAHVDVPFLPPLGFQQARLEEFGSKLCDPQKGLGLRPELIRLKKWDDLFGYELAAQFFGENGSITRTAERIKLGVRNGRTQGDWNIIQQTLIKFYNLMQFPASSLTHLSAHAHARFESPDQRDSYLNQFTANALVSKGAALGYVRILDWEKDIRVLIEHSNIVPNAVFMAWDTQFTNDQNWDSFLSSLPQVMENSANIFDIGFEPFKERVQ